MKRYSELSNEELNELNENQITDLIKIECLHEGIIIPIIPEPPIKPSMEAKDECFTIMPFDIKTKDKEAAEEIAAIFLKHKEKFLQADYKWYRGGSNNQYLTPKEVEPSVIKMKYYLKEDVDRTEAQMTQYSKLNDEYNKAKKEYDSLMNAYNEIAEKVREKAAWVKNYFYQIRIKAYQFKEYLRLSNDNLEVAKTFFVKVYGDNCINEIVAKALEPQESIGSMSEPIGAFHPKED